MKKLFLLSALFVFALTFNVEAQIRWPFGSANEITGDTNDTIDISPELIRGLNFYDISNDSTVLINVTTVDTEWKIGELLIIEATEGSTSADTLRYGTNITGLETTIPSGKTAVITFVWNGTAWVKQSENQID